MKKNEIPVVAQFLDQVMELVRGIEYTVRVGDDGFKDSVCYQVGEICNFVQSFKLEHLTERTAMPDKKLAYLVQYERLIQLPDSRDSLDSSSNTVLYRGQLYYHIKKKMLECDVVNVSNDHLCNWIEENCIINTKYEKLAYSKEWYFTSFEVVRDIADEIIEHRIMAPQQKLFD